MKLVKPSIQFLWATKNSLETIERAGRTCYKSEDKITEGSAERFVIMLLEYEHHAMIEHASTSYRVICDRGVTHEIVRHRLFSYAQESTRYCNYKGGVTFILPCWMYHLAESGQDKYDEYGLSYSRKPFEDLWIEFLEDCEEAYCTAIKRGWSPQQARSVLPNALKTEIVITGNLREWMHFFKLRTTKAAHPQMQEIANMLLEDIRKHVPIIFGRNE